MNNAQAAAQLGWVAPALMLVTALPMLAGYCAFGAGMWQATRTYRREWAARWRDSLREYSGPLPPRVEKMPLLAIVAIEFFGAMFGFPGLGWLYAGQALVVVIMLCAGPSVAWALIPMLTSPFSDSVLKPYGIEVLFIWLGATAVLSSGSLAVYLYVKRSLAKNPTPSAPPAHASGDGRTLSPLTALSMGEGASPPHSASAPVRPSE